MYLLPGTYMYLEVCGCSINNCTYLDYFSITVLDPGLLRRNNGTQNYERIGGLSTNVIMQVIAAWKNKMMNMKHHFKNSINMYLSVASLRIDICETYSSKSPGQGHHWHFLQNRKQWLIYPPIHSQLEPTGFLYLTLFSNSWKQLNL